MFKEMTASQKLILESSEGTSCRAIIDLTRKDPFTDDLVEVTVLFIHKAKLHNELYL